MKSTKEKETTTDYFEVAPGVWGMKILFVNVYMVQDIENGNWVLIDAGLRGSSGRILKMAEELFGQDAKPSAIILTHGHFDHIGAIEDLLEKWAVPVYAHHLEIPYLNGTSAYPPPDPTVGGGLMALMSWAYPSSPIDISRWIKELPDDYTVPYLHDWEFIHTPGHTPGHVSFYRERDQVLIAGDAFVTTQQESAFSVVTQQKKICGPPRYFTPDWALAYQSVKKLAKLEPEIVATGHGQPFKGEELHAGLEHLVEYFYEEAVPESGRYVHDPARASDKGVIYVPPLNTAGVIKTALTTSLGVLAGIWVINKLRK
jgi:glyoxylase-like metal-dependent hydrolase (beta-lactamase superfamily II)